MPLGPRRARIATASLALTAALAGPATAHATPPGAHTAVRDGAARFEVITPTLVRLEYAADGRFEDRPTFNVPERPSSDTRFRTYVSHGERVIATDALTLSYRRGSGPFSPANTSIALADGGSAQPSWRRPSGTCDFGTVCEAEDGRIAGGESVNYDHSDFTGRGFSADYGQVTAS